MVNTARKQTEHLNIRSDLFSQAKARKIPPSQSLEASLGEILKAQDRRAWVEENRQGMETANYFVAEHGLWSVGLRTLGWLS